MSRSCDKMTTNVPSDSVAARITYCPDHGRHRNPDAFVEALAGRPWACNRPGAGCGWTGTRRELVTANKQGSRVCPACGMSGGLQSTGEP